MSERPAMQPLDWMSAAFTLAIGLFLGLALDGLLGLVVDGFWVVALAMAVIGGGAAVALLAFDGLLTRATDRFFPSGIQPAANPKPRGRRPMARVLSLPAGLVLGMGLAQLGLTRTILDLL